MTWFPVLCLFVEFSFTFAGHILQFRGASDVRSVLAIFEVSLAALLFWLSYFAAMLMDPGFLPYTWIMTQKTKYSWEEQMSGLCVRPEQIEFARRYKPPFASLSEKSGRLLIDGNRYCFWIGNWIGKRNRKQVILAAGWRAVYGISLMIWSFFGKGFLNEDRFLMSLMISGWAMEFIITMAVVFIFVYSLRDAVNERKTSRTVISALKQVFGNGSAFGWIIPIPAFGDDIENST
jgi:hypothetical protein